MAVVSILVSCLQPVSMLSNPAHLNQSILIKLRLSSCHFTAQNLSHHLLALLSSATISTMHLLNEVMSSHHEWIFWHHAHYLSVAIEPCDFLFSQPKPCFYGTVPLLILFSPPIMLHAHLSKFYPSKAHFKCYLLHDVFQISTPPKMWSLSSFWIFQSSCFFPCISPSILCYSFFVDFSSHFVIEVI